MKYATVSLKAFVIALALGVPSLASGADEHWPTKPIHILGGYPAGGLVDAVNRVLSHELEKSLGVPVIPLPTPGGGGTIAAQQVARARPDGYTLLLQTTGVLFSRPRFERMPYSYKDFTPVATVGATITTFACAKEEGKWKDFRGFVRDAKSHPGQYTYSSSGVGSIGHLAMVATEKAAGIKLTHVPFPGGPAAVAAVLGGHVDVVAGDNNTNPDMQLLAVTNTTRVPYFPDVPTLKELGYDVGLFVRYTLVGPAGLAPAKVEKLERALAAAVKTSEYQELLKRLTMAPIFESHTELARVWAREDIVYKDLIEGLGKAYYQKK